MKNLLKRLFIKNKAPDHESVCIKDCTYCSICGMDHKTGTYEFKQGDRVEVVAGMFEGVKDKVIFVDYVDRNVELHAGVCIGFARVLNLIKGRADDVTGSMK